MKDSSSLEKIKSIIQVLEQAAMEHHGWLNDWHRSLIFGHPLAKICFSSETGTGFCIIQQVGLNTPWF